MAPAVELLLLRLQIIVAVAGRHADARQRRTRGPESARQLHAAGEETKADGKHLLWSVADGAIRDWVQRSGADRSLRG